ncbi:MULTISPECIES: hypothetical protein [Microcystis]|jgi:hypothetical protein|uniref:Genome sequencing data, contig C327 (Modular protein) n=2 Tax=Microcystis TaxID=1125 RepID=I4IRT5_MICAE|nr:MULTISPECIES: hypothetical protein [Microcystis]MCA2816712.1 hypothetical protein [Microcystis sp. M085S1]MCA2854562.1 hypothetical protein [Microcystis sp. M065S1]TRT98458.1 MAG: hypothetical protein EWV65_09790 [Microcystis flos-aquae Ma_QC_C_20070823_S18D]TRV07711.1 MAG: hypothetical protein EWV45_19225 [Microcystis flos-aquae Mf_QC_C_20070823_S10D]TRV21901.1 MAG: hypothetical protein EWV72_16565 [Microcystis flos-aquae Mf_QC_C_20070823_S10]TRV29914.1 MAG: hypothetical protein EWV71_230
MANITISELRPAGADLLFDSESFLDYLNDDELYSVSGGGVTTLTASIKTVVVTTFACGVVVGVASVGLIAWTLSK